MTMMSERSIMMQAWAWLLLPVMLFVGFWFRPWIALPVLAAIIWSVSRLVSVIGAASFVGAAPFQGREKPRRVAAPGVRISSRWWWMLAVVVLYVVVSGIGGFVAQMPNDHAWRNAVFFDLARRDWPVVYDDGEGTMLCYYFAFWLPSAVVAKVAGVIRAGDVAQVLYAAWGTWIALNMIFCMSGGKPRWGVLLVFIFFNAWDVVTAFFFSEDRFSILGDPWDPHLMWLSTVSDSFAASANPVIYNFIYNQGIAVWVFMSLFLHERNRPRHLMFLYGLLPIFAPIPALAFAPYVTFRLLAGFRRIWTVENVTGLAVAFLSAAFLLQNNSGGHLRLVSAGGSMALQLLLSLTYYALSFGVFIFFIWKYVRRDALYWSLIAMSVLSALVGIGTTPDLAWRMSIPAVVMTVILLCRRVACFYRMEKWTRLAFVAVMLVGSFSSIWTFAFTLHEETCVARGERPRKYIFMMDHIDDKDYNMWYDNFVAQGDSFYRKWLMPRRQTTEPPDDNIVRRLCQ